MCTLFFDEGILVGTLLKGPEYRHVFVAIEVGDVVT